MYSHFNSLIAFLAITLLAQGAFAHTYLSAVYLNNQLLQEGDCMRKHPTTAFDSPISSLTSADMSCGFLPAAQPAANRMCPITAGSTIGLQWHHSSTAATDDIVDPSHVGPIIFYLGKLDTDLSKVSWFKIYEDGYSNGQWAVNRLLANKGRVDVTIPADIAAGNYLLRGELLALHNGYELNGVQPYVGCVELAVSGGGSATPAGVLIPGAYKPTDPGMLFNVYQSFSSYPIPGPALYKAGSSSSNAGSNAGSASTPKPTNAPATAAPATAAPVTAAPVTAAPAPATAAPTTKPAAGGIQVQLYSGSSSYWVGVNVFGGSETTVKVEVKDSGSLSNYAALTDQSFAFVFGAGNSLVLPLSLRLTSSNGKQIILTNVFSSYDSSALVNTGVNYGAIVSTPKPSSTNAPTASSVPAAGTTKFTIHAGANPWWFALMLNGVSGATIKIKDSVLPDFVPMNNDGWAYTYSANGNQLVAPLTIRITANGKTVDTTLATISPSQVVTVNGQL